MKLIRSTAIISFFTMMSRILGLIRDTLMANYLGASVVNDALITATRLPNLFRRMFAEGAFNAAFIPLYARRIENEGEEKAAQFAGEAVSALFFLVALIVIGFQITMPWTLNLIGGGLDKELAQFDGKTVYELAVVYARITMPYLLLMSLSALISGMLNTHNRFAIAAFVPVLYNLVAISILVLTTRGDISMERLGFYLSIGMTLSGFLQLGLLYYGIKRSNIRMPFVRPRITPGVKRLWTLGIPGMISAGITQINIAVSHSIATIKDGAASWLYYADRLYQLPLGIIGIAMGVALLPALARRLRAGDESGAMSSMNRALEITAYLTIPATVALAVMPDFLIGGLFERGKFVSGDTKQTAIALQMFAFGLPAFVLLKVLTPAFFARENTRTPMIFAAISAAINLVFGATMFFTLGFFGLALATSIAAWTNVFLLTRVLMREGHLKFDRRLKLRMPRVLAAAVMMGIVIWFSSRWAAPMLSGFILNDYFWLGVVCGLGLSVYVIFSFVFRAFSMADFRYAFRRKSSE